MGHPCGGGGSGIKFVDLSLFFLVVLSAVLCFVLFGRHSAGAVSGGSVSGAGSVVVSGGSSFVGGVLNGGVSGIGCVGVCVFGSPHISGEQIFLGGFVG